MNDQALELELEKVIGQIAANLIESRKKYAETIIECPIEIQSSIYESDTTLLQNTNSDIRVLGNRSGNGLRVLKRVAIVVAAALILVLGMTAPFSAAARKLLYNAIFERHNDHYVVVFGPDDKEAPIYREFIVTYVPDGYELELREKDFIEEKGGAVLLENYFSGEEQLLISIMPRKVMQISIDSEHTVDMEIEFDGIEAHYLYQDNTSTFLWSDGRYEFVIFGNLDLEEYISISRGIKGIEN